MPRLTPAQLTNFPALTARAYPFWRARSLTLLSGQPLGLEREARLFTVLCQPREGEHWLDIGTSTGFYAGVLARWGCRVLAADLSPAMLHEAARRESSPLITWTQANVEASGWEAARFDGVTIGATLNETADPARLLAEAERLLRPDGQLWLMYVPDSGGVGQRLLSALGGLNFPEGGWTERKLPGCTLITRFQVGLVVFERFVKTSDL